MEAYQERLWGGPVKIEIEEFKTVKVLKDPRPDLKGDSKDWERLLNLAVDIDPQLASILDGFRCGGLRLKRQNVGYVLRPEFNLKTSLWGNQASYDADRDKWLSQYKDKLISLLDKLEVTV